MRAERPTPRALLLALFLILASSASIPAASTLPGWLAEARDGASVEVDGVRLGECASIRLSEPHVTVAQWIDGRVYRWKEIPQADGSLCTLMVAPQTRPLSASQAAALREVSGDLLASATGGLGASAPSARRPSRGVVRDNAPVVSAEDRALDRGARRLLGESQKTARARLAPGRPSATAGDGSRLGRPLVFGADDRIRTGDTTVFPYNTVAFIESTFPDGTIAFASGVLVAPYTVLTTALALYDPLLGGFAESVLVVPGQTQTVQGADLIEPFGSQFGIEIEVPQAWIDSEDPASSYGAIFLEESFAGIGKFYPIAFDLVPGGAVELIGYDESPQGETESFAQWRRTGTLVGSDELFVDHRMDDDFGAVGAPLATTGADPRLFAINCCVAEDDTSNVAVRLTSDIEDQITGWLEFEPVTGPLDGPPLFINDDRFRVVVNWRDFDGNTGAAQPVELTGDTGYFTIFDPDNVEVVIKVLDACAISDFYWVFAAGLTNLEIQLEVTDTQTQEVNRYSNRLGDDFQPILDTAAFDTCP